MSASRFALAVTLAGLAAPFAASGAAAEEAPHIVALTPADERHYRTALDAIDARNFAAAERALDGVGDPLLVETLRGRILAAPGSGASYADLVSWLRRNGELGAAPLVYERAQDIRPHRGRGRRRRAVGPPPPPPSPPPYRTPSGAATTPAGDSPGARAQIDALAMRMGAGDLAGVESLGLVALSGPRSGQAAWWLGLAVFAQGRYADAANYFERAAAWPHFSTWGASAAHYWAARARMAAGLSGGVVLHLEAAAQHPYTFYGQLAEANLGRESGVVFTRPPLDEARLRRLMDRHPGARRAAAFAQLGRSSEVDIELRRVHAELTPDEDAVFLALAGALRAPSSQLRAAEVGGPELSAGFCPDHTFTPQGGFTLDRAVVFGVIRQESHFNPRAVSPSNARGLMQLLPSTANDIGDGRNYRRDPAALFDPAHNMRLGQDYLRWLMDMFHQDRDLAEVFAAYNGGPGWLQRWQSSGAAPSDPLLLIEALPRAESRDYAERVLAHMGVCRARFGQPRVELQRLAAGERARYEPMDARANAATPPPQRSQSTASNP